MRKETLKHQVRALVANTPAQFGSNTMVATLRPGGNCERLQRCTRVDLGLTCNSCAPRLRGRYALVSAMNNNDTDEIDIFEDNEMHPL